MSASARSLRRVVLALLRVALRLYYRSVQVQGRDRFPSSGPVLLVANHPASLLDPALLICLLPRPVRIGARHTLFHGPLRPVLEAFDAIPLVREQDDRRSMQRNVEAFDRYVGLLRDGPVAAIFPEGITHDAPRLAPLKTGAARIALQAEAEAGFALGVQVVPVGLQFEPRRRVRADVMVRFGNALPVADFAAAYRREPREAALALTDRIHEALREVVFHVDATAHEPLVIRLADVYQQRAQRTGISGIRGPALRAELLQKIAACLNHYSRSDPASVVEVEQLLSRYERLRGAAGIDHRLLEQPARLLPGSLAVVQAIVEATLGAPLALFGALTSGVPYLASTHGARWMSERDRNFAALSLRHILLGFVTFPLVYGALVAAVGWSFGGVTAAVVGGLLIPGGLFALAWARRMRQVAVHLGGRAATLLKVDAMARVRAVQDDLLGRMEIMRDRYRTEVLGWEPLAQRTPTRR